MAEALPALMAGFRAKRDSLQNARLQDDIGEAGDVFASIFVGEDMKQEAVDRVVETLGPVA